MTDQALRSDDSLLTDDDLFLFHEGSHFNLWEKLGSHVRTVGGVAGTSFGVWAPNAERISIVGDFNRWLPGEHPLHHRGESGVWEGFVPNLGVGAAYKYHVESKYNLYRADKTDPFGFASEVAPHNASVVADLTYSWGDANWLKERKGRNALDAPISIYEVHLGSWRHVVEEDRPLTYREIGPPLADHVLELGFTHVEFLPLLEHPFYGSWGYQATGFFCATSRYGSPTDLMWLIDYLHQRGIGVILDWVPSHFPTDEHGLGYFDGTHLYEHADPRQGFHPEWTSYIFNFGRDEVRSFLISSALFWLKLYHIDGLRVDAVASMLYLDFARNDGEWIANEYGGTENIQAINFMRRLNLEVYRSFPDVQTIAEDSTAWPMVSRPIYAGGLGFGLKWDMGWMHDSLDYLSNDPIHRSYHHAKLTFRSIYAFHENYVLPLSHDEVVHLKGSLLTRMPGDLWQKFANLRLLFGYQFSQPGKKLIFMGGEFGQWREWNFNASLDWHLLDYPTHRGVQDWLAALNRAYAEEPALHQLDAKPAGFEWIDANDSNQSVLTFLRKGLLPADDVLVVFNFTPVPREHYQVGVPAAGYWREILKSDALSFGGSGVGNLGGVFSRPINIHGRQDSLDLTLPPLGVLFLRREAT